MMGTALHRPLPPRKSPTAAFIADLKHGGEELVRQGKAAVEKVKAGVEKIKAFTK